jgi:hypothetical protein
MLLRRQRTEYKGLFQSVLPTELLMPFQQADSSFFFFNNLSKSFLYYHDGSHAENCWGGEEIFRNFNVYSIS